MNNHKVAKQLLGLAKAILAMSDEEYIADQLNNAWEHMSERQMLKHLALETKYDEDDLKHLIGKWYDDVGLRMKMELSRTSEWVKWIRKELR